MKIVDFLKESKEELFNKLIELRFIDKWEVEEGDIEVDDMIFDIGYYEKGDDLIESDEICVLFDGFDVSFDRKFVKKIYGDESEECEFEFKDKKIFGLRYNC